jgi:hypothetical protein
MVTGVVVSKLVVVQVVIAKNMNFVVDSAGIVDKEKVGMIVGRVVGMVVDMAIGMVVDMVVDIDVGMVDFLEHILPILEKVVLVLLRRPSFPRHGCIP